MQVALYVFFTKFIYYKNSGGKKNLTFHVKLKFILFIFNHKKKRYFLVREYFDISFLYLTIVLYVCTYEILRHICNTSRQLVPEFTQYKDRGKDSFWNTAELRIHMLGATVIRQLYQLCDDILPIHMELHERSSC